MSKVHANGIQIDYEIQGVGQPLVLMAGISYSRWMWRWMLPGLAQHFQVIAFDNRGVGGTVRPAGPYSAEMLADDTAALLLALGIEKAHAMGHSMGGFIAQALALNHPQCVDRLILAATNFGGPRHAPVSPEAMAVLSDPSGDPLERFERGLRVSCAPGFAAAHPERIQEWIAYRTGEPLDPLAYRSQLAIGLGLLSEEASFERRLSEVRAPTLILFGEYDQVVPPQNAALLHARIADSRVALLLGAGHFFPIETPDAAVDAVVQFLKS
jgi:pimeloyl-ACP methyl ester carboxylesterase